MEFHGSDVIAGCLKRVGITHVFGLVGIPVTPIAFALQDIGVRFIATRHENAAGYAACGQSYMTNCKLPGICLVTGGPGLINALSGLAHATVNRIPLITLAGAPAAAEMNKGCFQDLDACNLMDPLRSQVVKKVFKFTTLQSICEVLNQAIILSLRPPQGGVLITIPANLITTPVAVPTALERGIAIPSRLRPALTVDDRDMILTAIKAAKAPLVVIGKGVHIAEAGSEAKKFIDLCQLPFLTTPMGRGAVSDDSPYCVSAARSKALRSADCVLCLGARLNWMLHFGDPPRWSSNAKFFVIDVVKTSSSDPNKIYILADLKDALSRLNVGWKEGNYSLSQEAKTGNKKLFDSARNRNYRQCWVSQRGMLTYAGAFTAIAKAMEKNKALAYSIVVAEGSKTLDISRSMLPVPVKRLDCGTWGTMGIGVPYSLAASLTHMTYPILAVIGDSAIGFALAELETLVRYKCKNVIIIVLNNGGIYNGEVNPHYPPLPTELSHTTKYHEVMIGLGGQGTEARNMAQLEMALSSITHNCGPLLIHVWIDPKDPEGGTSSGYHPKR